MNLNRRHFALGAGALAGASFAANASATTPFAPPRGPRSRVIIVNDLSGDIDGLFSTVHALLSPSAEVRAIIGASANSQLGIGEHDEESAHHSADAANEILRVMRRRNTVPVYVGARERMQDAMTPVANAGTQAIIDEAMRTDTTLPLYVTVGSGLTEVASALLIEPRIADRFTLVWIGGNPYPAGGAEYNLLIDPLAAQHVFNETQVPIWQVPFHVYASCQVSNSELQTHVAPMGAIGSWLYQKMLDASSTYPWNTGEGWTLGDSPLVLLTALTAWVPSGIGPNGMVYLGTNSSRFDEIHAPRLEANGAYTAQQSGRRIRAYQAVDTRLMFSDLFAKLRTNYGR